MEGRFSKGTREGSFDSTLVATFVISLGVAAVFFFDLSPMGGDRPTDDLMAFDPIEIDAERLREQRREKFENVRLETEPEKADALLKLVRDLNNRQFADDRREAPGSAGMAPEVADEELRTEDAGGAENLAARVELAAGEVIPLTGFRGFIAAGAPMFEACREGLSSLLTAVGDGQLPMETAVQNPPEERFETYRRNCGNVLPLLRERRLLDENGEWRFAAARTIFDILQRYRWANLIAEQQTPLLQLTRHERRLLFEWRIGSPEAFSLEKRREYLEQARQVLVDWPADHAEALLEYEAGHLERAEQLLAEVVEQHPNNDRYAAQLRRVRAKQS